MQGRNSDLLVLPSDTPLAIIGLTCGLVLEVDRTVGESSRGRRPGLGRRGQAAAFDLLAALGAARFEALTRTEREI